jgi:MFS family permease
VAQESQKFSGIFRNSLASSVSHWGINAKVLVATEGFWGLPMTWVFFYRPIFLNQVIGLSEIQIGLLTSVLAFFAIISPLAGGYLGDRFGRKRVFMLFDSTSWLSSMAVWIWTQNIWHALLASILEGFTSITYSIWECILVEDTAPEHRSSIYGTIAVIYSIAALSMPIAGYIIGSYGIADGTRTLFIITLASLLAMFTIRLMLLKETEFEKQIMKEKSFAGLKGYRESLSVIKKNRIIMVLLFTTFLGGFYNASVTFRSLFLIDENGLGLSDELASLIPAATSISSLIMALLIIPKLASRNSYVKVLALGYGLGSLSLLFLSLSPKGSLLSALLSSVILGIYTSTAFSVSRTFITNEIEATDSRARAKILSLTITLTSFLGLPAPVILGYLFSINPRVPFVAVSLILAVSLIMLLTATKKETSAKPTSN